MLRSLVAEHLPETLSRPGPALVLYWQWLALVVVAPLSYMSARLVSTGLAKLVLRVARLTHAKWDDLLVQRLTPPARMFLTGLFASILLPMLDLADKPEHVCLEATRLLMVLASFWALLRALDIAHAIARDAEWVKARPATTPVLALSVRVLKMLFTALGAVTLLQQLGYPVAGLIAGLGIGGLAVALAAQKTLENLLGSVMLSIDQPFRVGDLVRLDDTIGTVEQIGLRSTRIRTIARTMVTVPNGKLADMRCEDFSVRDRQHLGINLVLAYGTPADDLSAALEDIRVLLRSQPSVSDELKVHVKEFSPQGIVLEALAWFDVKKIDETREVVHLGIMRILERRHVRFALDPRVRQIDPLAPVFDAKPAELPRTRS